MSTENTRIQIGCQGNSPLPEVGTFKFNEWLKILECSDQTAHRDIKKYSIPIRRVGGGIVINAALWWKAVWDFTEEGEE